MKVCLMKRVFIILIVISIIGCSDSKSIKNNLDEQSGTSIKINSNLPWSTRIAQSFILRHPGSVTYDNYMTKETWNYEQGVMLEGMVKMYKYTADEQYADFVIENLDQYVTEDGNIRTYPYKDFNLDKINPGRALLFAYQKQKNNKYKIAADTLRKQLLNQPRTKVGGFWHKKRYPFQMWLDGLYMAEPFYADYSKIFDKKDDFSDIFKQFKLAFEKTIDNDTGLLYHAWNENKEQEWADKVTGRSPHFWGRAIGWYLMAIVDVLDFIPEDDRRRNDLIDILQIVSDGLVMQRDSKNGLWYQVLDLHDRKGNYLEASSAAMFTYAFAKGANKGYLSKDYLDISRESFEAILKIHVKIDENGFVDLYNTCSAAGLGGDPYRDGSFNYYISEPTRINDFKGYGPLLFSAIEIEKAQK